MSSILLIQSDPARSAATQAALADDPRFAISAVADTLALAREAIARRVPDLIFADLRLADGRITSLLGDLRPHRSHVLVAAPTVRDPLLIQTLRRGADAWLLDGWSDEDLRSSIRQVLAGESPMAPEVARRLLMHFDAYDSRPVPASRLSRSERRLLECYGQGYDAAAVAQALHLTPQQLGLTNRALFRRLHEELRARRL